MDMLSTMNIILQYIEDNLATAVTEIQTRNSVTLTPYRVLQKHTPLGNQFPAIYINPITTEEMEEGAGNRDMYGNPSKRDKILGIRVVARGNPTSSDTVETDVIGYMDALEELFKMDYSLTGIKGVDMLDTLYTDLIPDTSVLGTNDLLKGATLQIRVRYNII